MLNCKKYVKMKKSFKNVKKVIKNVKKVVNCEECVKMWQKKTGKNINKRKFENS